MTMTHEGVEGRAEQVLRKTNTYRKPVPIEVLAHRLNLTTEPAALGQSVSGILVVADEREPSPTTPHILMFDNELPSLMR
jgi:hypothetical protein